jgi:hypothetical protein
MLTILTVIIALVVIALVWRARPLRPHEPGFKFVRVNQDGSVRELSPGEQAYLSESFPGWDGGRPYIKSRYKSRDGWGSQSGFIERRYVPARIRIAPVHPDFDARDQELGLDPWASNRAAGDLVEPHADGSITYTPNPKISRAERFKIIRDWHLAHQREREKLAAVPEAQADDDRS